MKPLRAKADIGPEGQRAAPGVARVPAVVHLSVGNQSEGQRLDNFLQGRLSGLPRSAIYRIIRTGQVRVNGHRRGAQYKIALGDEVRVPPLLLEGERAPGRGPATAARPLRRNQVPILHEDDALIVLDKPAGLAVHGGSGIQAGLIEQLRATRPAAPFLELVHRLDRDTSGLLLVAKARKALVTLHRTLARRQAEKRYFAVVKGYWGRSDPVELCFPLHRFVGSDGERRVRVQADGQAARTRVHLVRYLDCAGIAGMPPTLSLLDCTLLTGRTHQIRVHLAQAGFPILGDAKYGDFALNRVLHKLGHKRMFLHAHHLALPHPGTGLPFFARSALPAEFGDLVAGLRVTAAIMKLK